MAQYFWKAQPLENTWPNGSNTGPVAGTVFTAASSNTLNSAGTYSGLIFNGFVTISASNVTLINSVINGAVTDPFHLVISVANLSNIIIQNVRINGVGAATTTGSAVYGIYVQQNSQVTIKACDISQTGHSVAINDGQVFIVDNYFHHLLSDPTSHYECIYYGGSGTAGTFSLDMEHNTFDGSAQNQTAAVYIENFFGPVSNVTIHNNLLLAPPGDYALYIEGNQNPNNITNVTVTNNAETPGAFGYNHFDQGLAPVYQVTHSGNYDWITKANLD